MLYVGEGPGGSNGTRSTLCQISVTPSSIHNQIGPLWCWFPSGWACAHSRPLWVSPTTSPVRLGVSPAAAPTPMGVFSQRFETLFPRAGALGCTVCFAPHRLSSLSVHECGATGSASGQTACSVCPTLCQSQSCHSHASPLRPGCPSPPLLPVWMNVYFLFPWCQTSLPFDFLSVLVVRGGSVCLPMPTSWFCLVNLIFRTQTSIMQMPGWVGELLGTIQVITGKGQRAAAAVSAMEVLCSWMVTTNSFHWKTSFRMVCRTVVNFYYSLGSSSKPLFLQ